MLPLGGDHRYRDRHRYRSRYRLSQTDTTDCDGDVDPETDPDAFGFPLLFSEPSPFFPIASRICRDSPGEKRWLSPISPLVLRLCRGHERTTLGESNQSYNEGVTDTRFGQPIDETAERVHLPPRAVLVLAQLDPRALGLALGLVCGLLLWLATVILLVRAGPEMGQNLSLLSQYFIGFRVTPAGSALALCYGAAAGFLAGYLFARLRNLMVHSYMLYLRRRAERVALADLLDRLM